MGFREGDYLFQGDLGQYLAARRAALLAEVERLPTATVMAAQLDDLAGKLVGAHECPPVTLRRAETYLETDEIAMSVDEVPDGRLLMGLDDEDEDATIQGTSFVCHVPFDGEKELFRCGGSSWNTNPPRATIFDGELVLSRRVHKPDATQLKGDFERVCNQIEQTLREIAVQVERFNQQLTTDANVAIVARRDKLEKAGSVAAAMGYTLKRRADAPATFTVSLPKKRIAISPTPASASEPVVASNDYEEILKIMESMALMLERSPNAFRSLKEEELRFFFLVYLNGQYDGGATGETFNFGGKTDILVTSKGRNVFIAECKFWSGAAVFTATIDQLLGYLSWRDTKTAIVVFNRDTQMSTVVRQIPGLLAAHPNFKLQTPQSGETRFRATFQNPNDPDREVVVTVLVFDVPGNAT